jgi:hypothetical protein
MVKASSEPERRWIILYQELKALEKQASMALLKSIAKRKYRKDTVFCYNCA